MINHLERAYGEAVPLASSPHLHKELLMSTFLSSGRSAWCCLYLAMSGLEAVGIAASIIQVADLGTKLSVKLFTFYRQVQNANQAIQSLSSDVALTCAILRELGESLKDDEHIKICSAEAHRTAQHVLNQCEGVLKEIRQMIDDSIRPAGSRWQQAASKIRNVLNEPNVDLLKGNLERLKSTMLLLLNVIMYAGQIRK